MAEENMRGAAEKQNEQVSNPEGTQESLPRDNNPEASQAKVEDLEKSVNQLKDQLLRKAAEFENYKKRTENDISATIQYANERLLEELLPVIDDFERSLKMGKGARDFETLFSGVGLIYQKFLKVLEAQGMKPYESIGKPFDTAFHDALLQISKEGVPPHTVVEEVEKGYMLNNKVLRHAKVIVSKDAEEDNSTSPDSGQDGSSESIGEA